jgi:hypothetical protein
MIYRINGPEAQTFGKKNIRRETSWIDATL